MSSYLIFGLGALGTFLLRAAMSLGEGRLVDAARLQRQLAFVSPAVLAAIVTSALFVSNGSRTFPNLVVVAAVVVGAYAVRRTGNVAIALGAGLPIYWIGSLLGLV